MQVTAERLNARLRDHGLDAAYFFHGEEPLQLAECADAVRQQAVRDGVDERIVFDAEVGIDWPALSDESRAMSLFAARRLLEIRLGGRKPDKSGGAVLEELTVREQIDDVLLITAGKLDAGARKTRWFKAVEKNAVCMTARNLKAGALPGWLNARARRSGKRLSAAAAVLIADRVEGNMLAAAQEVEKLCLLVDGQAIGEADVVNAVRDSARYDVFQLTDAVVAGELARAIKVIRGLREEGAEPVFVNWALGRELRQLASMAVARAGGMQTAQLMEKYRIWQSRRSLVTRALDRFKPDELFALLAYANFIDTLVKGARAGDPWDALEILVLNATGHSKYRALLTAR
jgi:DNA polymerase III subunit delta